MANKNLLTYSSKITSISQSYYGPSVVIPPLNVPIGTLFCFLAKVDPWPNDNDPIVPTQDQKNIKKIFKNIFAVKRITTGDISPVIQRINWESGTTYDYYKDDEDMFVVDTSGLLIKKFYVKNKYDQVFKCLWNNSNSPSTVEPYFEPGTYGTNNIFKGTDNYKWKYMYTIDTGSKVKFMDSTWLPIPLGANTPNPLQSSAGAGSIDVINVINGGSGYDPANAVISVSITGDGIGASATAQLTGGSITDIIVTNPGTNYTYANASITTSIGSGAILSSPTSPIGGHAFDPVSELGCSHIMFTAEFNSDESGLIPTDIDFHQVGMLITPTTLSDFPYPASGSIYKTTTDVVVASGFGSYVNDEVIYQGTTLETATFTGVVLSFDPATNVVRLINTTGSLTTNTPIFGNNSKTTRTLLAVSYPNFVLFSGYIDYIENRTGVQRSPDGIEQFKFVLGY